MSPAEAPDEKGRYRKRPTFFLDAGDMKQQIGDEENFKRMIGELIWSYVAEIVDGETETFEIGRIDMSRAEEETLPEI